MPFAAALSEHPLTTHAVGEVVGTVLERLGPDPDLAVVFVTGPHAGALEDVVAAVRVLLGPGVTLAATAGSVLGGRRQVERRAAVGLWAARFVPAGALRPVRLAPGTGAGDRPAGLPADLGRARTLVVLADPASFDVDALLAHVDAEAPGLAVVGGLASGPGGVAGTRLAVDGHVAADGAVGVLLDAGPEPAVVVAQGCRPIGEPFIVTRAERGMVRELGGRPALERLMETIDALAPPDRTLAARGLECGVVIDESRPSFDRGDFVVRAVLGADRAAGAVALRHDVAVGSTVQFQVRDRDAADQDLRDRLDGARADGALVFAAEGRGAGLFGVPDHDARVISDGLGTDAVAGISTVGELAPLHGRNLRHGLTASVALFRDRAGPPVGPAR